MGRLAVILVALLAALAGAARADWLNPCGLDGFDRPCAIDGGTYRALKPAGRGPFPAVVYLHGSLGRSDAIASSDYFQRTVADRGYVLIAPTALDAVDYVGGRGTGWSLRARDAHPRDDVAFLRRVLAHARERFRIDPARILMVGQSDGGFLIWEIACHDPDLASAYATHAGSYGGPLPPRCRAPVRFLQVHGRADAVVPFEAVRLSPDGRRVSSADVREGLALLARASGCRDAAALPGRLAGFARRSWRDCARGAQLDYLVHDGGHGFPPQFMSTVLDWFEAGPPAPAAAPAAAFRAPGRRDGGPGRFLAAPAAGQ